MNPMDVRRGIQSAVDHVVGHLDNLSKDVVSKEEISQVACISANNERDVGDLISNAIIRTISLMTMATISTSAIINILK